MARTPNPALPQLLKAAAIEEFAQHGLAAAKVSAIAERAGTSKGAFYLHFASKEGLYVEIAREFLRAVEERLSRYACRPDEWLADPAGCIQSLAARDDELLGFFRDHRQPLAMVVRGAMGTPCAFLFDEFIDTIQGTMERTVAAHPHPHGPQAPIAPEFFAAMATGLIFMYARRILAADSPPHLSESIQHFRKTLVLGMMMPPQVLDAVLADPLAALQAVELPENRGLKAA